MVKSTMFGVFTLFRNHLKKHSAKIILITKLLERISKRLDESSHESRHFEKISLQSFDMKW